MVHNIDIQVNLINIACADMRTLPYKHTILYTIYNNTRYHIISYIFSLS